MNEKILKLMNLNLDEVFKNIKEDDKAAKEIIKNYCEEKGNKLDSKMQMELIEKLVEVNKREVKLVKLLKELKIKFYYSHVRDEDGYKYIWVNV